MNAAKPAHPFVWWAIFRLAAHECKGWSWRTGKHTPKCWLCAAYADHVTGGYQFP